MYNKRQLIEDVEEVFGVHVTKVEVANNQILCFYEGSNEPITLPIE